MANEYQPMRSETSDDVCVSTLPAGAAPHSALASLVAESYTDSPTYNYILQTTGGDFQRRFLTVLYRGIIFPPMRQSSKGVCLLATHNGEIVGSLFISRRHFDDGSGSHAHGLRDPVDSFGELVDSCTAGDSTVLRQGLHRMHVHLCTLWLSCQMGPFALSRLLRYGAHGKELNRRFAAALGGRDDQPAPMWRIDHVFVRPEWRGRGICRRLINIACVGADTAGATLYLSTSAATSNVPMYRKLGFEVVGAVASDGELLDANHAKRKLHTLAAAAAPIVSAAPVASAAPTAPAAATRGATRYVELLHRIFYTRKQHQLWPQQLLTTGLARAARGSEPPGIQLSTHNRSVTVKRRDVSSSANPWHCWLSRLPWSTSTLGCAVGMAMVTLTAVILTSHRVQRPTFP